ncbi:hypothetical protein LPJ57_007544, partial [Coemansia sp. RSA 486]
MFAFAGGVLSACHEVPASDASPKEPLAVLAWAAEREPLFAPVDTDELEAMSDVWLADPERSRVAGRTGVNVLIASEVAVALLVLRLRRAEPGEGGWSADSKSRASRALSRLAEDRPRSRLRSAAGPCDDCLCAWPPSMLSSSSSRSSASSTTPINAFLARFSLRGKSGISLRRTFAWRTRPLMTRYREGAVAPLGRARTAACSSRSRPAYFEALALAIAAAGAPPSLEEDEEVAALGSSAPSLSLESAVCSSSLMQRRFSIHSAQGLLSTPLSRAPRLKPSQRSSVLCGHPTRAARTPVRARLHSRGWAKYFVNRFISTKTTGSDGLMLYLALFLYCVLVAGAAGSRTDPVLAAGGLPGPVVPAGIITASEYLRGRIWRWRAWAVQDGEAGRRAGLAQSVGDERLAAWAAKSASSSA